MRVSVALSPAAHLRGWCFISEAASSQCHISQQGMVLIVLALDISLELYQNSRCPVCS